MYMLKFVSSFVDSLDKEWLRVKSGRSKGCKDCINHRCVPSSCSCDCHK